jgi:hypothetical protein
MARFTTSGGSGSGVPGPQGPQGIQGEPGEPGQTPDLSSYAGDILPAADNTYVLGNSDNRWKSISIGEGTIFITDSTLGTEAEITIDNGVFLINGIAQVQLPNIAVTNLTFADNTVQTTAYTSGSGSDLGNFTFDESTARVSDGDMILEANEGDGSVAAQVKVGAGYFPIDIAAYQKDDTSFYEGDWSTAEWQSDGNGGGQVIFTGSTNITDFLNTTFSGEFQTITINNEFMYPYNGGSYGGGNGTLYITTGPEGGTPVTITSLTFGWSIKSGIKIDYDNDEMNINASNIDMYITAGDDLYLTTNEDDIHLRANDDIRFVANYNNNGTEYNWNMNSEGVFNIPGNINTTSDTDLLIRSESSALILDGNDGEFLGDSSTSNNQIATIGDIANAGASEASFTVNGGSLGTMPTFDGAPLFSGSYVKTGPLVHFQIQVDMDNITNFGTGQYYVDLPFHAKYGYQFKEGCLHDISTGKQYAIGGHVYAGQSQMVLTFTNSNGQDEDFDYNSPVALSTADNFHIAGTYITN